MKVIETPQMTVKHTGERFKVLHVTGDDGMCMPEHISTMEAVVMIHKGSGVLTMNGEQYSLKTYDSMIIPGGVKHTLRISGTFEADVIMEIDSEIRFVN